MPRRLTLNDVKNRIEKYGFFIVDGETYKNNSSKMKVFDAQENKYLKLSLKNIEYRIKKDKRGEFDYMNILPSIDTKEEQDAKEQLDYINR